MPKKILAIDDTDSILDLYRILLRGKGYELTTASTGREGLEALRAETPDLVLLDIGLPDISGWDILRIIRRTEGNEDLPVIVATVLDEDADVAHGWILDCTSFLSKPLDADRLVLLVDRLLEPEEARLASTPRT